MSQLNLINTLVSLWLPGYLATEPDHLVRLANIIIKLVIVLYCLFILLCLQLVSLLKLLIDFYVSSFLLPLFTFMVVVSHVSLLNISDQ